MNLSEFKAWFDGFTENIDGPPNKKQWDRITSKVKTIREEPASRTVFVHDYWRPRYDRLGYPLCAKLSTGAEAAAYATGSVGRLNTSENDPFDAPSASAALGRAEYADLTA